MERFDEAVGYWRQPGDCVARFDYCIKYLCLKCPSMINKNMVERSDSLKSCFYNLVKFRRYMYLGVSKRSSNKLCEECGRIMRFTIPVNSRNVIILFLHFFSFVIFIGVSLKVADGLEWIGVAVLAWLITSAVIRRSYVPKIVCQACDEVQAKN